MPEIQLGGHTVRTHGAKVARFHMHDWVILLLLALIDIGLNLIEPFHRFVGEDMMTDLRYLLKGNTVPIIAILLPLVIILVYYFIRKDVYDLHHAILGLLFSVMITDVLTDAIKDGVGRPRPDFFWRCFPDGVGVFDPITKNVMCTGKKSVIKEGHKSFPSGHTSSMVGVSRVDDYWHHWQDVFSGGLLGVTVSSFCYLQFFPPPYDTDGWGPHAYFQMLADSGNAQPVTNGANNLTVQPAELESIYIHEQQAEASPTVVETQSKHRPDAKW